MGLSQDLGEWSGQALRGNSARKGPAWPAQRVWAVCDSPATHLYGKRLGELRAVVGDERIGAFFLVLFGSAAIGEITLTFDIGVLQGVGPAAELA